MSAHLNVQEAAAKAYVTELKSVGLLTDECRATDLALRWRLDETYAEAVQDILNQTYPESLRQVAPPGEADRAKVTRWFQHDGLGLGAAGNKAATYILIGSPEPNDAPSRPPTQILGSERVTKLATASKRSSAIQDKSTKIAEPNPSQSTTPEQIPLNVNVQIHISADAGIDQIDAIFSSMRRYLYDQSNN